MNEFLILVDEKDRQWGKWKNFWCINWVYFIVHFQFLFLISKGELLLQQRADEKYHSGGLWTNTCCSHPVKGENIDVAIERRIKEEMGMECKTDFQFSFIYKTEFENGLTEHEFDHVYFGEIDELPIPEKSEVQNWKYITLGKIKKELYRINRTYIRVVKDLFAPELTYFVTKIQF